MNTVTMKDENEYHKRGLAEPFGDASTSTPDGLTEFLKLLARIAADKDYNELLEKSKTSYNGPKQKGPKV
jgi:hypothetical protein